GGRRPGSGAVRCRIRRRLVLLPDPLSIGASLVLLRGAILRDRHVVVVDAHLDRVRAAVQQRAVQVLHDAIEAVHAGAAPAAALLRGGARKAEVGAPGVGGGLTHRRAERAERRGGAGARAHAAPAVAEAAQQAERRAPAEADLRGLLGAVALELQLDEGAGL